MAIATFPEVIHIALINDLTPQTPRFRTDIDDIIRRTDNLLIMFHHDHGIPQGLHTSDGGVRVTALGDFLARSARIDGRPAVTVMRLRDTTGVAAAIERARKFIGQPYDYSFRPDNGKMYCSELVWESYLAPDGSRRFPARPMNFLAADGSLPRFWAELFAGLGEEIPQDIPGTNPNDMARDPQLKEVARCY